MAGLLPCPRGARPRPRARGILTPSQRGSLLLLLFAGWAGYALVFNGQLLKPEEENEGGSSHFTGTFVGKKQKKEDSRRRQWLLQNNAFIA